MWFLLYSGVRIPCVNTITYKLSIVHENDVNICSYYLYHTQNCTQMGWFPAKFFFLLFGGDTDQNCQSVKPSLPASVQHQFSLKFVVHLYVGFAALHPDYHFLELLVVCLLHVLLGRNWSLSKFCVYSQICFDEQLNNLGIITGIPFWRTLPLYLQKLCMKCRLIYYSFVNVRGILNNISAQHNRITPTISMGRQRIERLQWCQLPAWTLNSFKIIAYYSDTQVNQVYSLLQLHFTQSRLQLATLAHCWIKVI
jgi:hypothetical protein